MKQHNTINNNSPVELSYFGLSLLSFLKESHPHLASDTAFIKSRADEAATACHEAILLGVSYPAAEEVANLVLFRGLHFSKHDTIVNILWNEFADIIPQSEAGDYAGRILPLCESLFLAYTLTDEFAYSPEYDKLYTELTGFIAIWLEEDEL